MMDLDELQTVQSRERQTDSLQQLRESFYEEAGEFVQQLRRERERAAERADDPFDAPEVNRLTDDINTAEATVEAIYERRVGKIVKMASLAAADMPTDDEGLTREERELFETLVESIEENRERVFDVLDGESPATGGAPDRQATNAPTSERTGTAAGDSNSRSESQSSSGSESHADQKAAANDVSGEPVDAADLMGAGPTSSDSRDSEPDENPVPNQDANSNPDADRPDPPPDTEPDATGPGGRTPSESVQPHSDEPPERAVSPGQSQSTSDATRPSDSPQAVRDDARGETSRTRPSEDVHDATHARPSGDDSRDAAADRPPESEADPDGRTEPDGGRIDRTTVRITDDVGSIYGVDDREYDLSADDVVRLPAANAGPLVDRGAAERLD